MTNSKGAPKTLVKLIREMDFVGWMVGSSLLHRFRQQHRLKNAATVRTQLFLFKYSHTYLNCRSKLKQISLSIFQIAFILASSLA